MCMQVGMVRLLSLAGGPAAATLYTQPPPRPPLVVEEQGRSSSFAGSTVHSATCYTSSGGGRRRCSPRYTGACNGCPCMLPACRAVQCSAWPLLCIKRISHAWLQPLAAMLIAALAAPRAWHSGFASKHVASGFASKHVICCRCIWSKSGTSGLDTA